MIGDNMSHHHPEHASIAEPGAAVYINYKISTLRAWRRQGRGPAYIRYGRSIRYRIADLDAWVAAHRVDPTRQTNHGA